MKDIEKLNNNLTEGQDIIEFETEPEQTSEAPRLVEGILRRWYIVFAVFIVICGVGIPAIWLFIKPVHVITGQIHVAPILVDIMTDTRDRGEISDYQSFMNTQAEMVTSSRVVQRVADNLKDRDLALFRNEPKSLISKLKRRLNPTNTKPEPAWLLKRALINGDIVVSAPRGNELIEITMYSNEDNEAMQIVDAFINAYMEIGVNSSTQDEDQKLATLEDERKVRAETMDSLRKQIYQLAQEYGTATLSGRQDMMLRNVASLMSRLTELESSKMNLKAQAQLLERTRKEPIAPDELMKMRQQYINRDTAVESMTERIAKLEQSLIIARQTLTPANSEVKIQAELVESMRERLKELKDKASKEFDELLSEEVSKAGDTRLMNVRTALEQTEMYEEILRETIAKEDEETIRLGRIQLNIQDLQDQLNMTKERYDMVLKRIQDLQMQRKRQPRISVHDLAHIAAIRDRRMKLSIGVFLGAIACGLWLAYIRDKADLRLRTPEDVAKRIGIRIIGTTTSLNTVKPALLPQQIIGDYQTIRANLGFLDGEGVPKKLVVTSPGMKEGKTTFAINLATSMAEAGKKVLLIDGDLRKPDVARLLNLPKDSRGLQDVLCDIELERAVYSIPSTGLDVLAADFRDAADAYELLALSSTSQRINQISNHYDHVIIDTPPVLAFPDALMWAKIGDAVILTSFAGQTTLPELRETKERLMQINVRILGTVVSSVDAEHSYYRQDYGYYAQSTKARLRKKSS
jgi:succinoglycan biosynthesis transport protein ExoP